MLQIQKHQKMTSYILFFSLNSQIRPLMDYIQHDDFKKPKFFDDICLLHFKKPFIQNRHVQTIQLTSKTPYYGTDCYISGWGASSVRNLLLSTFCSFIREFRVQCSILPGRYKLFLMIQIKPNKQQSLSTTSIMDCQSLRQKLVK